jgi:hypothetical protein
MMGSKSLPSSISSTAKSRIERTLLRRWTASDSGEVSIIAIGNTGDSTSLLITDCRILLLKVIG